MGLELSKYYRPLMMSRADGPTLTAAAAATCLPTSNAAKVTLDAGHFGLVGKAIQIRASGRISCVVTTPGTARYDIRFTGPTGTVVTVFDSLAMNLNIVAKTNVHWELDLTLICNAVGSGTSCKLFPECCTWKSEAVVGSPLPTAGGSGVLLLPYNTAPVEGTGFDGTVQQSIDMFFTQTVATGSMTLHNFEVIAKN